MPQSTLSFARTVAGLTRAPTPAELTEILFAGSKAEAARIEGDDLIVEVTPDRLDLLSEGGLAQHLEGLLDERVGLPAIPRHDPGTHQHILVDPSVDAVRPAIAGVLAVAPPGGALDAGLLAELVRFQELLHATIGLDRRSASLGIYPWERIRPPLHYRVRTLEEIRFAPLDGRHRLTGVDFFASHPMAAKYGTLGRVGDSCLVLEDAEGELLSLPPILNSIDHGEARPGDRSLLLESTGRRAARVEDAVGYLELPLLARGWSVSPVRVDRADRADTGEELTHPRSVHLASATLDSISGERWESSSVVRELARARLAAEPSAGGWVVDVPPWRPDLQGPVDLVEDVLTTRGLRVELRPPPPSRTRGRRAPETALRAEFGNRLLGLGFVPLFNTVLVPEGLSKMLGRDPIALANPVSTELGRVRDTLQIPLLGSIGHNVRFGYPQRLSEVGPVVLRAPTEESGARTTYHAGFVIAGEGVGFADAATIVDYLLRRCHVLGVREPTEWPGTIPGRAARLRLAGEPIAVMGEIHPSIITELGVPVPVAFGEVDLTALGPLLGRAAAPTPGSPGSRL